MKNNEKAKINECKHTIIACCCGARIMYDFRNKQQSMPLIDDDIVAEKNLNRNKFIIFK